MVITDVEMHECKYHWFDKYIAWLRLQNGYHEALLGCVRVVTSHMRKISWRLPGKQDVVRR